MQQSGFAGAHVKQLVFVMSAWASANLGSMRQPFVAIEDAATKQSLCGYYLEDQPQHVKAQGKSVVMCRLFVSATGFWEVQAVGQMLPQGTAETISQSLIG